MALLLAVGYMLIVGIAGIILPWLPFGPNYAEFRKQTAGYKLGSRTREVILGAGYVLAGIALFQHQVWARTFALILLLLSIPFAANAFAWGFSEAQPTRRVRLFSWIAVAVWNGFSFFLTYRLTL